MANATIEIEIKALDKASKKLDSMSRSLNPLKGKVKKLGKEFDDVDKSIKRTQGSFSKLKGLLAGALTVGGISAFTKSVTDAYGASQDMKVALETVTGSAAEADKAFKFIRDFTEKTPFQVEQVNSAFVKLKNAGIEPTAELLTTLGDAASVSTDKVGALTAIADLYSRTVQGGLGVEELDRLQERGIPVYDILSKKLGIARQDVSEFGKTAEGAAKVTQALTEGFEERFGGGMARASETLNGRISTLKDTMDGFLIKVGEGGLGDAVQNIVVQFEQFIKANDDLAYKMGEFLGNILSALPGAFMAIKDVMEDLAPVFDIIKTIATEIVIPLGKLAFETLVGLAEAIAPVAEKWIPILKDAFVGIASAISGTVTAAFEGIKSVIEGVMSFIEGAVDRAMAAYNTIKGFTDGIKEGAKAVGDKAVEMGGAVIDAGGELLTDIKDTGKGWYNYLTSPFADAEEEVVGNSIVPDMVTAIGQWMDKLPNKMALPAQYAADSVVDAMNRMSQSIMKMSAMSSQGFTSPVSGIGASAGPVNSNVNFNISGVNLNNDRITPDMKKYVEGVAIKVANQVLRQQTNFGGLI